MKKVRHAGAQRRGRPVGRRRAGRGLPQTGFRGQPRRLFERGIKEFTPLILRMMAQKVDAFEFDGNSPGDAGLMLKQIRQAGFKGKVIQIGGPAPTRSSKSAIRN